MRFLLLSPTFFSDPAKAGTIQQLAQELVSRGNPTDIISIGRDGVSASGPWQGDDPGLRAYILGAPAAWAPTKGPLKYTPTIWRAHLNRSLNSWLCSRYDAFLFFTPGLMSAGLGTRLKRNGTVNKTGFLLWDFFPVSSRESDSVRLGRAERIAYELERRLAVDADILFAMSPAGAEFAKSYYRIPTATPTILPPWGSPLPAVDRPPKYDRFTCAWGGQFIPLRAIPDLLEAARILEEAGVDVDFRLAGDGPLLEESRQRVGLLGLRSVHFEGRLARSDYVRLLERSHLALSVIEPMSSPCFPSKTVDYCQAGLPLVASVESCSDFGQIIERAGFGSGVEAGDTVALARKIHALVQSPDGVLEAMSRASRRYFDEHLSVDVAATTIERAFSRITV